jgi:cytochrome c oxidase subunit 2
MLFKQIKMFCICYLTIIQTTCDLVAWSWVSDASPSYRLVFEDPTMGDISLFNFHLLFVIIAIVIVVGWLIFSILFNFTEFKQSSVSNFVYSNRIEIIRTTLPALILVSLASLSFSLLYSLDEISNPSVTFKILGHQWYWSYESSDFIYCSDTNITLKYSSYMLTKDFLIKKNSLGFFRNLETNKRMLLPVNTHLRLLVTAVDVLHSWTIPSFGIKIDACPGRLNQSNLFIKRFGLFYGQCSEICGVNHGFMPIVLLALPSNQYYFFINESLRYPKSDVVPESGREFIKSQYHKDIPPFEIDQEDIYNFVIRVIIVAIYIYIHVYNPDLPIFFI